MKSYQVTILSFLLCFSFWKAHGQAEVLKQKLFAYSHEHPVTNLYVHLDKNFYLPGENIWFKAYLLDRFQRLSKSLYVRVVNDKKKIVMAKEFLVHDIRSHGDITLPDTLPQGNYEFYAFSDNMINFDPRDAFVQPFKVSLTGGQLNAEAHVSDTQSLQAGKTVDIVCHLKANGVGVKKATVNYKITDNHHKLIEKGREKTSETGKAVVSFVYPAIDSFEHLKLEGTFVTRDSAWTTLALNLPPQKRGIVLTATPEGGSLIHDVPASLLISTRDQYDQPMAAQVLLKSNGDRIADVITDSTGLGIIRFTPDRNKHYQFIIQYETDTQTTAFLQKIASAGWALHLKDAGKSIVAVIYNKGMPDSALLVLRSMQQMLWSKSISVKSKDSLILALPDVDTSKQMLSLALFNNRYSLYAERLFLSREQQNYLVTFQLNKSTYGTREKVDVTIYVTDDHGKPVKGNFSVAAVAQKVLDEKSYKTIVQSSISHALAGPAKECFNNAKGENDINSALINSRWQRYSWPKVLAYKPKGTLTLLANSAGVVGYITSKRKRFKLKDMKDVYLFTATTIKPMDVKADGGFSISPMDLLTDGSKDNYILVNEDFRRKYRIEFENYADDFDKQIVAFGMLNRQVEFLTATKPPELPPSLFAGSIRLKTVNVTAQTSGNGINPITYQKLLREYPKGCLDYVCIYNYLNCPVHHNGRPPVIGERYDYQGRGDYLYTHCLTVPKVLPNNFPIKRVQRPNPFPLPDYQKDTVLTPQYSSTIFWNPNINTNDEGKAFFEFYSSDLKGIYKIIVQGFDIKTLRAIYGKTSFVVK